VKRQRTPSEKKALSYKKDYITIAEYPHAFRRNWPRKKARLQRAERRKVRQLLRQVTPEQQAEERDYTPLKPVRRRRIKKWGVTALGTRVRERLQARVNWTAWNFFKSPYNSKRHREKFVKFLETLIEGRTEKSQALAHLFDDIMAPPRPHPPFGKIYADRRREWLQAFFKDEPAWEGRLRTWIQDIDQERSKQ
jgi:hypothetical protein